MNSVRRKDHREGENLTCRLILAMKNVFFNFGLNFVLDIWFLDFWRFYPLTGLMELLQSPERESGVVMYLAANAFPFLRYTIWSGLLYR